METKQNDTAQENSLSQEDKALILKALKSGEVGKEKLKRAKKLFENGLSEQLKTLATHK